jgi:hypothetical protein
MAIRPCMRKHYRSAWKKLSKQVIAERGNKCEICHLGPPDVPHLTTHHLDRNPENNDRSNLLVCCPAHHFQQEALINAGHQYKWQLSIPGTSAL